VHFAFDRTGAFRFGQLTGENRPNPSTPDVYRHLGIILDKRLLSAPRIITRITDRGMISGGAMTEREVDHIIEVLNAGSLPAALNKTPISQEVISPTLGTETIESGKLAIGIDLLPGCWPHRVHCAGVQFGARPGTDGAHQSGVYAARTGRSGVDDRHGG
jgi:preprotein translocase subunit SecD